MIVDLVPSGVMNTLKLIRVRCRREAVWRVGIHKGTSESLLSKESEAAMLGLNSILLQSVTAVLSGNFPLVSTLLSPASLHPGSFKRKASGWSGIQ